MQPGQCSPVQEAAAHEFCSRLGAISSVSEAAPAVQALGEPQVVHMLPYSSSVLALPGGQHWGTAEQTAAAHQRGLQCMSDWSRSVKAMTAASHQLQPQHLRQPFLPSCASLPGGHDTPIVLTPFLWALFGITFGRCMESSGLYDSLSYMHVQPVHRILL